MYEFFVYGFLIFAVLAVVGSVVYEVWQSGL